MSQKQSTRQSRQHVVLPMLGNAVDETLDLVLSKIDAQLAKHFEDRNILLTDGGVVTFTGTEVQFTEALNLVINQKISGAAPQVISLGSTTRALSASGKMIYAVIDRTAGTAVVTADADTLPAAVAANQEVFLIAKRVDAGDGTQRVYWRTGMGQDAGQSIRLGSSGSGGSGSGVGDDLGSLLFRASFNDPFDEGPAATTSAVDSAAGKTDAALYSASKKMYTLNYDASKTIAATSTATNVKLSAVASFTVKAGDVVVYAGKARKITTVNSQSDFVTESFGTVPVTGEQVTVSQAVHTKDIYNLAVDGNSIQSEFGAETFSEILVDYEDTTTAGDAIFDINTVPVIGFDASNNLTAYTDVQKRPTLGQTQMQSAYLPSAGTALYLRFFAVNTSGSGTVNVLKYKAFLQKSASASAGGALNCANGFTNGVGTPVNATVGLMGGKTTITTSFSVPVGVNPGSAYGSCDVYLNGQLVPRFQDSVLTPDASYTEVSPNVFQLDRNYSTVNLSFVILQRVAIVDNSEANRSAITAIQDVQAEGTQGFVSQSQLMVPTASPGSPVNGSFYSSVQNRATMVNLAADLKASMGIERIPVQQIYQIPTEVGPNGEMVYGVVGDQAQQIRFVGTWVNQNGASGQFVDTAVQNDYVEITFYGTGLNLVAYTSTAARDARVSVDGGADSADIYLETSNVLINRQYTPNVIMPAVSGLTLGVHTVRVKNFTSGNGPSIAGFEVINNSSPISVNPGISYVGAKKLVSTMVQSLSYASGFDSGTVGTRGGRVIMYQKADGTIGKAAQTVGSQLNLAAADHSIEEQSRSFNFREFGSGRSDDFSTLTGGSAAKAFTLDDGTTSLVSDAAAISLSSALQVATRPSSTSNYLTFTFVGTGLDILFLAETTGTAQNYTVIVDGVSAGTLAIGAVTAGVHYITKIVSGLSMGTHSVRFTKTATGTSEIGFKAFNVYQPKKPTVPVGSVELADYNVTADYNSSGVVGTTTLDYVQVPSGTIFKSPMREMCYTGAAWTAGSISGLFNGGFLTTLGTNAQAFQYTFFGTGFMISMAASGAGTYDYSVNIDGSLNASGVAKVNASNLTAGSYRSTSTTGNAPSRVEFTGLTLGMHTVTITKTAGAGVMGLEGVYIITPVYAAKSNTYFDIQNTGLIGSCNLLDIRKTSMLKDSPAQSKNISQAYGVVSGPTVTSTNLVPMADMSVIHTNKTGRIKVSYSAELSNSTIGNATVTAVAVDTTINLSTERANAAALANDNRINTDSVIMNVSPGTHKVDIYWRVTGATTTANGIRRTLTVEDV